MSALSSFTAAQRRILDFAARCERAGLCRDAAISFAWGQFAETGALPRSQAEYDADLAAEFAVSFVVEPSEVEGVSFEAFAPESVPTFPVRRAA